MKIERGFVGKKKKKRKRISRKGIQKKMREWL